MIKLKKYTVLGRVQGVWYRASTCEAAINLGIKGRVRNQSDGSVYVEAEGTSAQLDQLKSWLEKGSPLSSVDKIIEEEGEPMGFSAFKISY